MDLPNQHNNSNVSANFHHNNPDRHLQITQDSGNLVLPQPLIVNDLYQNVDALNGVSCIQIEYENLVLENTNPKILSLNIRSLTNGSITLSWKL